MIRPEDEELNIKTGGKTLSGWLNFRVVRSVEHCPSGFAVALTERYPDGLHQTAVEPFNSCEVFLSGDKVLTGYIDHYQPVMHAQDHQAGINGRSKTEDLVDCSVDIEKVGWQISAATVGAAAKKICDPYGIEVSLPDGDVALDTSYPFPVMPGMTCWQLLEELARAAQMLIWDDAEGRLVLSKVGTKRAGSAIVEGENAEIAGALFDGSQRYSDIWVVAQAPVQGTDGHVGYFAKAQDKDVPRRRVHMIVMDMPGPNEKWAKQRAEWEIARRYGRSRQIQVTVVGWRDGKDQLWTPNTIARVHCPTLKIDEDWLIVDCDWRRSEQGTQTVMRLMPKQGVIPEPFVPLQPIPLT
jgi:prophage tail gpP-like protein